MSQGNVCPKVSQKRNSLLFVLDMKRKPSLVKSNIFCVSVFGSYSICLYFSAFAKGQQ